MRRIWTTAADINSSIHNWQIKKGAHRPKWSINHISQRHQWTGPGARTRAYSPISWTHSRGFVCASFFMQLSTERTPIIDNRAHSAPSNERNMIICFPYAIRCCESNRARYIYVNALGSFYLFFVENWWIRIWRKVESVLMVFHHELDDSLAEHYYCYTRDLGFICLKL